MVDYKNRSYTDIIDHKDQKKIESILKIIPNDVRSIIDVGCGNGLITNELDKHFDVLGIDINETKLQYVNSKKLHSSCDNINRPDNFSDLVFSSELLEHLDEDLYQRTLNEFNRLTNKYILITVPNKEPLHKLIVKCSHCGTEYNKNGHLRRFSKDSISKIHPNWKVINSYQFGRKVRDYHKSLSNLKHKITPSTSWIPNYWIKNQGISTHFCTSCGKQNELSYKFHPIAFLIDGINVVTSGKNESQLLALFEKIKV